MDRLDKPIPNNITKRHSLLRRYYRTSFASPQNFYVPAYPKTITCQITEAVAGQTIVVAVAASWDLNELEKRHSRICEVPAAPALSNSREGAPRILVVVTVTGVTPPVRAAVEYI